MSCKTILVHAATAGAIDENSVTTHADPVEVDVADVIVDEETCEVVLDEIAVLDEVTVLDGI